MTNRWSASKRIRVYTFALGVLLWGASAINYSTAGPVSRTGSVKGGDYAHFYLLGRLAASHRAEALYDSEAQRREFEVAVPGAEPPHYLSVYGPQVGLALAPLGRLPYFQSLAVWWILAASIYLLSCWAVWRRSPKLKWSRADFLLFTIAYPGFWELFIHGQTTWIALGCFCVLWFSVRRGLWLPAGIALGLLFYKPQLGLAIFLVLVAGKQWRVLLTATAAITLQAVVSWYWFGGEVLREYLLVTARLGSVASLLEPNSFQLSSLRGFFILLGVPSPWSTLLYILVAVLICRWLLDAWKSVSYDVAFAILILATILIAPHATVYDLILLAPALIILANAGIGVTSPGLFWPLLGAAYLVPLSGPLAAATHIQLTSPVLLLLLQAARKLPSESGSAATMFRAEPTRAM